MVILIETGLRSVDCLRLPLDPITTDEADAPYLSFFNHKASKEGGHPDLGPRPGADPRQQADLGERYATAPRFLLPGICKNPDGRPALSWSTLNHRLGRWLADGMVRDAAGRPVRITARQFRHTVGTRMINNEVPLDIVQRMLDHGSPEMTAATRRSRTRRCGANGSASDSVSTSAAS